MIHFLPDVVLAEGMKYYAVLAPEVALPERDDVQEELRKLAGAWVLVYWLFDGKEQSLSAGRPVMSFSGAAFTIRVGEEIIERGAMEALDPDRTPKALDYAPTEVRGRPVQLKYPGIYILQDDLFIACIGYRGKRPRAFSAEATSMNELVVYKRLRE
jgi:uncharacterized protein (TIGR03067 family)